MERAVPLLDRTRGREGFTAGLRRRVVHLVAQFVDGELDKTPEGWVPLPLGEGGAKRRVRVSRT